MMGVAFMMLLSPFKSQKVTYCSQFKGPSYEEAQAVKQATKRITRCSSDVYVDECFSAY